MNMIHQKYLKGFKSNKLKMIKTIFFIITMINCLNWGYPSAKACSEIGESLSLILLNDIILRKKNNINDNEELKNDKDFNKILLYYISCHLANEERDKKKREAGILGKLGIYK